VKSFLVHILKNQFMILIVPAVMLASCGISDAPRENKLDPKATNYNPGGTSDLATNEAPVAPTNVSATGADSEITISWTASAGATSYNIYWSATSGVTAANSAKIMVTTLAYTHTSRVNGTTYYDRVSAVNANGESALSSEISGTPVAMAIGTLIWGQGNWGAKNWGP
jgi:hypothetical protein